MSQRYTLPLKFKFLVWLINLFEGTSYSNYSLNDIKRLRKEQKRGFLVNWILGKPVKIHKVENKIIPVEDGEIGIRIYRPSGETNLPVIINYHGGGWVIGCLQNNDYYCHLLAKKVLAVVISVDYRLAPEYKFPTQPNDGYAALKWAFNNGDKMGWDGSRIGVTGDSAGGNIATVCCLMARDQSGPEIKCQALIYPATDATLSSNTIETMADAPFLSKENILWFRKHYLNENQDLTYPYLSPFFAESHQNLPPGIIITADYDPLKGDGIKYAEKLREAGVAIEMANFKNEVHAFMSFPNHAKHYNQAMNQIVSIFKKYLI